MSFIQKIGGLAKQAFGFLRSDGIGSTLARTALLGYALNRAQKSIAKASQATQPDPGVEVTLNPDPNYRIPVLYGSGFVEGKITDAVLANNNTTMWICYTLCEKTGNLIDGTPSTITFNEIYYNNLRLGFRDDGITSSFIWDDSDASSDVWDGLIQVYPFVGGSENPVSISSESNSNTQNAYDLFPGWTSANQMEDLVFCIVKINYNKFRKLTNISPLKVKLTNTMSQPGDVMYDYMTNTRYGAGIPVEEINAS